MGILTPKAAHAEPFTEPPVDTSRIYLAHMSTELTLNIPSEVISKVSEPYTNFTHLFSTKIA